MSSLHRIELGLEDFPARSPSALLFAVCKNVSADRDSYRLRPGKDARGIFPPVEARAKVDRREAGLVTWQFGWTRRRIPD